MPSTSQELADIFGESGEEHDIDFPFSLNMGKAFTDLSLPDSREADFFLNSLNSLDSIPVSSSSSCLPSEKRSKKCSAEEVDLASKAVANESAAESQCGDQDVDVLNEGGCVDMEGDVPKDNAAGDVTLVSGKRKGQVSGGGGGGGVGQVSRRGRGR